MALEGVGGRNKKGESQGGVHEERGGGKDDKRVSDSRAGAAGGGGPGGGPDSSQPRFSSSLPTYRLRLLPAGSQSGGYAKRQPVVADGALLSPTAGTGIAALQGPPPHVLLTTNQVTLNWKVKGQVVVPKVGSTQPWIQILFYLVGRRWDEPDPPPPSLLPCVRAMAIRDTSEAAPSAGCRLMGPSGICVVRLEIPPAWFTPTQVRKRPPEVTLPSVDVYYSVIPVEGAGQECPFIVNEPWRGQRQMSGLLEVWVWASGDSGAP
ncbi:transmembrane protein 132D-like [Seriola lalandi dorsalis]|uniref:transmembrane protein 132D-like n=1 Tax=Seriola lalandi dorsalis TaxID=1841481 RepID=UPI000C6F621B|nr:transmembrane protein 132D-like [Seriola lalandi dorsalis]